MNTANYLAVVLTTHKLKEMCVVIHHLELQGAKKWSRRSQIATCPVGHIQEVSNLTICTCRLLFVPSMFNYMYILMT